MSNKVSQKLICTGIIQHKKPLDLILLTKGFVSLANMYGRRTEEGDSKLQIQEVRHGSIEVDLIAVAAGVLLQHLHPLVSTIQKLQEIYEYLLHPFKNKEPKETTAQDYVDTLQYVKIGKQKGNSIQTSINNVNIENVNFISNYYNYPTVEKNYKELMKEKYIEDIYTKQLFYWQQINFEKLTSGNRGIITRIDAEDKQVIFNDKETKEKMKQDGTSWQKKGYIVDVVVQRDLDGKIKVYKIIELHAIIDE